MLRAVSLASLAALGVSLAGCGGPSDEEIAMRDRAIQAAAQAEAAQARGPQIAAAPAPTPEVTEDAEAETAPDEPMDDPEASAEQDGGDNGGGDNGPSQYAMPDVPPPVPFLQPPAMIDVPQPDAAPPFNPAPQSGNATEYVRVNS